MQRDALDFETLATLLEFRGPVSRSNGAQIREQRTIGRKRAQHLSGLVVKAHQSNRAGLFPSEGKNVLLPVNVLRLQKRDVRLRSSQVPGQLVESLAFGIQLAGDNGLMLVPFDGALFFKLDGGPTFLGQDRPRQPAHIEGEVVDAAKVNVGGNRTLLQDFQEVVGLRLQHDQLPNRIEGFVFDGGQPAMLGFPLFELENFVHHILPGAGRPSRIARLPIHAGQMQAEGGSVVSFVFGGDEAIGFVLVARLEALLFPGDEVFAVVGSPAPAEHSVSLLHVILHGHEHEPTRVRTINEQWLRSFRGRLGLYPSTPGH
jgi:hypothetical protein